MSSCSEIVLEPLVAVFIFMQVASLSLANSILLISRCVEDGGDTSGICLQEIQNKTTQGSFQNVTAPLVDLVFTLPTIEIFASVLPCILLGGWSDKHGRKFLFILPIMGSFIRNFILLCLTVSVYFSSPFVLMAVIIGGFLGGKNLFVVAASAWITDTTDNRTRLYRFGILFALASLGSSLGTFLGSQWLSFLTARTFVPVVGGVLTAMMAVDLGSLLYVRYLIPESVSIFENYHGNRWINLIAACNVKGMVNAVFKQRYCDGRFFIALLVIIFVLNRFVCSGEEEISAAYLFVRFGWTHKAFILRGANLLTEFIFVWVAVSLSRRFEFDDAPVAIAGTLFLIAGSVFKALSIQPGTMGFAIVIESLSPLVMVGVLSLLSKLIDPQETGCLFANIAVLTFAAPTLASLSYWQVFKMTHENIPEFVYLMSVFIATIFLLLLVYVRRNLNPLLMGIVEQTEKVPLLDRLDPVGTIF